MKLTYKILWFEDEEDVFQDTLLPPVQRFLEDMGYTLEVNYQPNGDNLPDLLAKNEVNGYDLILSDVNLGDKSGDQIVTELRAGNILTEVLLYSGNPAAITAIIEGNDWIERASFCVGRPALPDKIKLIIQLTVRKQQDVNNARGLVIAETILLEKKVENILESYFSIAEGAVLDAAKAALLHDIREKKREHHASQTEYFIRIHSVGLEELIEKDVLTAANTVDAILSILNERIKELNIKLNSGGKPSLEEKTRLTGKLTALKSTREELTRFHKEILAIRNTLAHVIEEKDTDGTPYLKSLNKDGAFIKFDAAQYTKIRKDLRKHSDNLEVILEHLLD